MLETFQKSLDKHSPQVVVLYWILLGRGGGTGDFLSSPLVLFSSTLWLLSSYCRSAGKVKEILAQWIAPRKHSGLKNLISYDSRSKVLQGSCDREQNWWLIGFMKPWAQTNTWKYPSRKRELMYSTGRYSSGSQSLGFDPIALSCFGGVLQAFCKKTNDSSQHVVQMCVLPSWRVPDNHQWNRQKGKQSCSNSFCGNSKTQSLGLVMW